MLGIRQELEKKKTDQKGFKKECAVEGTHVYMPRMWEVCEQRCGNAAEAETRWRRNIEASIDSAGSRAPSEFREGGDVYGCLTMSLYRYMWSTATDWRQITVLSREWPPLPRFFGCTQRKTATLV